MTKTLVDTYREQILDDGADLITGNVKICGTGSGHTYTGAEEFLDDLSDVIATSANLGSKTKVDGYFDAADTNLGSPAAGPPITALWTYLDTGTPATSRLVHYTDEDAAGDPLSITPNGEQINLTFHTSGLFRV
jgi:hypothetical protein